MIRKPFVIRNGIQSPLTDIQSRRRARLLVKTKSYRDHLARQRRTTKHLPRQRTVLPRTFALFPRSATLADPKIALLTQAIEALDDGRGKPTEQRMLELELWTKLHRGLVNAARNGPKPRP